LNAPFSASATEEVLKTYGRLFNDSPVGWRVTSKDSILNYRSFQMKSVDTITIAIKANHIKPSPLTDLMQAWTMAINGAQQVCDFSASTGLEKIWLFLGHTRQIGDVLDLDFVPNSIRRHLPEFKKHGLDRIRTLAVDWRSGTVNIYWRAPGPLDKKQADGLLAMAGCDPIDEAEVKEIARYSSAKDGSFAFAVTLSLETGDIGRSGFYATKLLREDLPVISDERVRFFLDHAPDYDREELITIAWGFGKGGKKYMKAEVCVVHKVISMFRLLTSPDNNNFTDSLNFQIPPEHAVATPSSEPNFVTGS
ncbi:prenyltransferase-like protein, partial [Leptodontidium sp. 2 PMI_412]